MEVNHVWPIESSADFAGPHGGPVDPVTGASGSQVNITNTIVRRHARDRSRAAASVVAEDYNLFFGTPINLSGTIASGGHSLTSDPKFVAAEGSDAYHLSPGSSAIDHGVNLCVPIDLDGLPRLISVRRSGIR